MSGFNISGISRLESELEQRFGRVAMQRISDKALKAGGELFINKLKQEFKRYRGKGYYTGATIDEMQLSEPMTIAGVRTIKVYWRGPKDRYRIIHLNEFGSVKIPNPPRKGTIARTLRDAKAIYKQAVEQELRRGANAD